MSFTIAFKLWPPAYSYTSGITFATFAIADPSSAIDFGTGKKLWIYFDSYLLVLEVSPTQQYSLNNPCNFGVWCHLAFVYNLINLQLQVYKDGIFYQTVETGPLKFFDSSSTYGIYEY